MYYLSNVYGDAIIYGYSCCGDCGVAVCGDCRGFILMINITHYVASQYIRNVYGDAIIYVLMLWRLWRKVTNWLKNFGKMETILNPR